MFWQSHSTLIVRSFIHSFSTLEVQFCTIPVCYFFFILVIILFLRYAKLFMKTWSLHQKENRRFLHCNVSPLAQMKTRFDNERKWVGKKCWIYAFKVLQENEQFHFVIENFMRISSEYIKMAYLQWSCDFNTNMREKRPNSHTPNTVRKGA